jgi:hypothetical protein
MPLQISVLKKTVMLCVYYGSAIKLITGIVANIIV